MAYPHKLPDLPYPHDALEPHIDAKTMEIHHSKHHKGYTDKLNQALEDHRDFQGYSAEQLLRGLLALPEKLQGPVRNNGGGFHNHSLFWKVISPGGASAPAGSLASQIEGAFGSFDAFKERLSSAAAGQFGSGWGWLVVDPFGNLQVTATANQDSPLIQGSTPILGVDVWEHAYYLMYQNRRPEYLEAFWNVVNWDVVGQNYEHAKGGWLRSG
jgi:superoxide dismutase, Fe-Mn family